MNQENRKKLINIVNNSSLKNETKNKIKQDITSGRITSEDFLNKIIENEKEKARIIEAKKYRDNVLFTHLSRFEDPKYKYTKPIVENEIKRGNITKKDEIDRILRDLTKINLINILYTKTKLKNKTIKDRIAKKICYDKITTKENLVNEINAEVKKNNQKILTKYLNNKDNIKSENVKSILNEKIVAGEIKTKERIDEEIFKENKNELIRYLSNYDDEEYGYGKKVIIDKIESGEITTEDEIIKEMNEGELVLKNYLYQFKDQLGVRETNKILIKIDSEKIPSITALHKEIGDKIEEIEIKELNTYLKNNYTDEGYKKIKRIVRKKINERKIISKEEIDDILGDLNKIKLINRLYSKKSSDFIDIRNLLEDKILSGEIKNLKQVDEEYDMMLKNSLKKYLRKSRSVSFKEIEEDTIKKIDAGKITSKRQIDNIVTKFRREFDGLGYEASSPKNDMWLNKILR